MDAGVGPSHDLDDARAGRRLEQGLQFRIEAGAVDGGQRHLDERFGEGARLGDQRSEPVGQLFDPLEDDGFDDLVTAAHVAVERRAGDPRRGGDVFHRCAPGAVLGEALAGGGDDALAGGAVAVLCRSRGMGGQGSLQLGSGSGVQGTVRVGC